MSRYEWLRPGDGNVSGVDVSDHLTETVSIVFVSWPNHLTDMIYTEKLFPAQTPQTRLLVVDIYSDWAGPCLAIRVSPYIVEPPLFGLEHCKFIKRIWKLFWYMATLCLAMAISVSPHIVKPFKQNYTSKIFWYMATPCLAMAPLINKMMIQMTQQTGQDLLQVLYSSWWYDDDRHMMIWWSSYNFIWWWLYEIMMINKMMIQMTQQGRAGFAAGLYDNIMITIW